MHRLSTAFQLHGFWWPPGQADLKVRGVFDFVPGTGIRLSLRGNFFPDDERQGFAGLAYEKTRRSLKPAIILGAADDGCRCTITDAMPFVLGAHMEYFANCALLGDHFSSESDMNFAGASAMFNHLEEWIMPGAVRKPGVKSAKIGFSDRKVVNARILNPKGTISIQSQVSPYFGSREFRLVHRAMLNLSLPVPLRNDAILEVLSDFQGLLTLLTGLRVRPTMIRLDKQEGPTVPKGPVPAPSPSIDVIVSYRQVTKREVHTHEMMLPLRDLRGVIRTLVENWFSKRDQLRPSVEMLLSSINSRDRFARVEYLDLVSGLESFHRQVIGGGQTPLRTRLVTLLEKRLQPGVIQPFATDKKSFADRIVNTRDFLAHHTERLRPKAITDPEELSNVNLRIRQLLVCLVLQEIGLSTGQAWHAASRIPYLPRED
jgi:ApeA N-terminal domain 1